MAEWIPVAAKLRAAFFLPPNFHTPIPVTAIAHAAIIAADLRVHRIILEAECSVTELHALRTLSAAANLPGKPLAALLEPIYRDLNETHIVYKDLGLGGRLCGLAAGDFKHITGPALMQNNRVAFTIPGSVARAPCVILEPGIVPMRSWPGWARVNPIDTAIVAAVPKKLSKSAGTAVPYLGKDDNKA